MNKLSLIVLALCLSLGQLYAQTRPLPAVDVKNLEGKTLSTKTWSNDGKPVVVSFWATWCKPCINELVAISEVYDKWKAETGVKVIAVSIDDARNSIKVGPFVNGKGWDYEVFLDVNQDLKRAMNVNNVPHTFVLDGNMNIVWQHNSYSPGGEEHIFEIVKQVAAGKPVEDKK